MIKANSYYSIACNEFWYLRDAVSPVYCNPAAASAQQIAEKMLNSVAELVCTGIEKLMSSHICVPYTMRLKGWILPYN